MGEQTSWATWGLQSNSNDYHTPHTPCHAANSGKKRRRIPYLSRTVASPSHAERMSSLFSAAAEELHKSPCSSALTQTRHTKFAQSFTSHTQSPYSYRNPTKCYTAEYAIINQEKYDKIGKEPVSSGYVDHVRSAKAGNAEYGYAIDIQYPNLSEPFTELTQPNIDAWLDQVGDADCSPSKFDHAATFPRTKEKDGSTFESPLGTASNKENISPTRSFSPDRPPVTYDTSSTPSPFQGSFGNSRPRLGHEVIQTPSRFQHPLTPRGHLALPPPRRRKPLSKTQQLDNRSSGSKDNENDTIQHHSNFIEKLCEQRDMINVHEDIDCQDIHTDEEVTPSGQCQPFDFTIAPKQISSVLANLSPAISIRKARRRPRDCKGEGPSDQDTSPDQRKVLRSGRVVDVLGQSSESDPLCQAEVLMPGAQEISFDFEM